MKSCSGITTTSLIIYVVVMLIVVGIIANITSFFYTNVLNLQSSADVAEITKFNLYFLEEIKNKDNNKIESIGSNYINFTSGNAFTFQDNCIYYNSIRICENIKNAEFAEETLNGKTIIKVIVTVGNELEYTKTNSYVI